MQVGHWIALLGLAVNQVGHWIPDVGTIGFAIMILGFVLCDPNKRRS